MLRARQRAEAGKSRTRRRFDGRSGPVRAGEPKVLRRKVIRGTPDVAVVIDVSETPHGTGLLATSEVLDTMAKTLRGRSANVDVVVRAALDSAEVTQRFARVRGEARDRSGDLQEDESIMAAAAVTDADMVIVLSDGNTAWPERWQKRGPRPVVCLIHDRRVNEGEVERLGGAVPSWADVVTVS